MPAIVIVTTANTMNQFRLTINQLVQNVNSMLEGSFITAGNLITTQTNAAAVALNVANGYIRANGILLFTLQNTNILTGFTNAQLNSNSFIFNTGAGITGAATVPLGNTITFTINPVDSLVNTRTDLAAAANSVAGTLASVSGANVVNATQITIGIAPEVRGGTGKSSFAAGDVLIGDTTALRKTNFTMDTGLTQTLSSGGLMVSMNLIQGSNVNITSTGNGAITIGANGAPYGSISQAGLIILADDFNTPDTTLGVTANAVKAMSDRIALEPPPVISSNANGYGRLLQSNVYIGTIGQGSRTWTWLKPANLAFIVVTCIGPGGGGGGCNNFVTQSGANNRDIFFGTPGASGAFIRGVIPSANLALTQYQIHIGEAGKGGLGDGNTAARAGGTASNTMFGNNSPASVRYIKAFGGVGGRSDQSSNTTETTETGNTFTFYNSAQTPSSTEGWSSNKVIHTEFALERPGGIGYSLGMVSAGLDQVHIEEGGRTPGAPGRPGIAVTLVSANGNTTYSDALGFGHGGSGSIALGGLKGSRGGNGAPGIVIIEAYSNV